MIIKSENIETFRHSILTQCLIEMLREIVDENPIVDNKIYMEKVNKEITMCFQIALKAFENIIEKDLIEKSKDEK